MTEFVTAVEQSKSANSIIFDSTARDKQAHATYLFGVVLSKLNGDIPPFKEGEQVVSKQTPIFPVRKGEPPAVDYSDPIIKNKKPRTVTRVLYNPDHSWWLHFREHSGEYSANYFRLAPEKKKRRRRERPFGGSRH